MSICKTQKSNNQFGQIHWGKAVCKGSVRAVPVGSMWLFCPDLSNIMLTSCTVINKGLRLNVC